MIMQTLFSTHERAQWPRLLLAVTPAMVRDLAQRLCEQHQVQDVQLPQSGLALLKLRDEAIISLDGSTQATVTDAYSQMIGNLGVLVQSGKTSASISATLADTSQQTLAGVTGVNLDEEAAKLIQFQQSYQAAAKVLQIAQSLFDTLLQTARG